MNGTEETEKKNGKGGASGVWPVRGRIYARFRNIYLLLFAVVFSVMAAVMAAAFGEAMRELSSEYAGDYAVGSAEALSAHIGKELGLMSKAAHSTAVTEWMADEQDAAKRALAYREMSEIVGELYSYNLYAGIGRSLNEYQVGVGSVSGEARPFTVLEQGNEEDAWYFECVGSKSDYLLSVDIDRVMQRKRIWLDYKVMRDGEAVGVLATGLEFSHVLGELFSRGDSIRGFIVGKDGMAYMDSSLMGDRDFLYHEFESPLENLLDDPALLSAVETCIGGAAAVGVPESVRVASGGYRYVTAAPVAFTDWTVVILSGDASLLSPSFFLPAAAALLALLLVFAILAGIVGDRLIFRPLGLLNHSLRTLGEEGSIYGIERDDELGHLSQAIEDLFTKSNVDALTGIRNRRAMETGLEQVMRMLPRSGGMLSVLMADIDFFKKYNDAYGHEQGDSCLRAVAAAIAGTVRRSGDFAARYGGEEFLVVLPNTDESGAQMVAEKLLENVRALKLPHTGSAAAAYVTVSVGVTTGRTAQGQSWEDYVKRADEALYFSKQNGRNRYTFEQF